MSFVPYVPDVNVWNYLPDSESVQKFYPLQKGKGSAIQVVSPEQAAIERAKMKLKRQLNSRPKSQSRQSSVGKRRKNISTARARQRRKKNRKSTQRKQKRKTTRKTRQR